MPDNKSEKQKTLQLLHANGEVPVQADGHLAPDTCLEKPEPRLGARREAQVRLPKLGPPSASAQPGQQVPGPARGIEPSYVPHKCGSAGAATRNATAASEQASTPRWARPGTPKCCAFTSQTDIFADFAIAKALALEFLRRVGGWFCLKGRECRRVRVRVRVNESERVRERRPQSRQTCLAEPRSRTRNVNAQRPKRPHRQHRKGAKPEATPTHTVRHAPTAKQTLLEQRLFGSQETSWRRTKNQQRSVCFYRLEAPLYYTRGKRNRVAILLLYTEIHNELYKK